MANDIYGGNIKSASTAAPRAQGMQDHLAAIKSDIGELTGMLRAIADRTDGPHPQAIDADRDSPPRYLLSDAIEIRKMLANLREQAVRLDGAL